MSVKRGRLPRPAVWYSNIVQLSNVHQTCWIYLIHKGHIHSISSKYIAYHAVHSVMQWKTEWTWPNMYEFSPQCSMYICISCTSVGHILDLYDASLEHHIVWSNEFNILITWLILHIRKLHDITTISHSRPRRPAAVYTHPTVSSCVSYILAYRPMYLLSKGDLKKFLNCKRRERRNLM